MCLFLAFEGRGNAIGGGPERGGLLMPSDRPETAGVRPSQRSTGASMNACFGRRAGIRRDRSNVRSRRFAVVADRGHGRRNWAEIGRFDHSAAEVIPDPRFPQSTP